MAEMRTVVLQQAKTRGRTRAKKRDSDLKCIDKKKLKQHRRDNNINALGGPPNR